MNPHSHEHKFCSLFRALYNCCREETILFVRNTVSLQIKFSLNGICYHVAFGKLFIEVPNPSNVLWRPSALFTSISICSAPALSPALALNVALADGDELRAVGENGALPRTKLLDNTCPEMFELTGKFSA